MTFYDALETRSADARAASLAECLPALLTHAQGLAGYEHLAQFDLSSIASADDLIRLPVLRKSELGAAQKRLPPFGGYSGGEFAFRSVFACHRVRARRYCAKLLFLSSDARWNDV